MDIIQLHGEAQQLYPLVGPLVMEEEVLKYNLNYPYRTSPKHRWFIARENNTILGFIPVKITGSKAQINNYYVTNDNKHVFSALLKEVINTLLPEFEIESVIQLRHIPAFEQNGFSVVLYWKRYAKMKITRNEKECV